MTASAGRGQAVRRPGLGQERRDARIARQHQVVAVVDEVVERLVVEGPATAAGMARAVVERDGMARGRKAEGSRETGHPGTDHMHPCHDA